MSYYIWIIVNLIFIIGTALYVIFVKPHPAFAVRSGQYIAQIALIFFLININMYFILLVIRKARKQSIRVTLAKMARRMMRWHIPIALFATSLIIIHALIMLIQLGQVIGFTHLKMTSGMLAMLMLALTIFGGYRRYKKASGFRRKFHYMMAFAFAAFFILHMLMPV